MEEMKNGMNASNENNIAEDLNEVTTENATRTEVNDNFTELEASAPADVQCAEQAGTAPVDYSIGAGAREDIRRAPTMAYNTSDTVNANAGTDTAGSAGQADTSAGNGSGSVPPVPPENGAASGAFSSEPENPAKHKKPRKPLSDKAKKIIACVLVLCIIAGVGFGGGAVAVKCLSPSSSSGGTQTIKIDSSDAESLNAASAISKKVMPSVVGISTVSQTYTQTIFGLQQGTQQGVGTGIIVSSDGYILTNSHVVSDGQAVDVKVLFNDGSTTQGKVLWNDAKLDLAMVKVDKTGLTAAELGDSDQVRVGDIAIAIGNPLGLEFQKSVTQGIISGLDRTIQTEKETMTGLMQTDASINPGNSGGPLLNEKGQVIGINSAKVSSAEGIGFSIPINTAKPIIEQVIKSGNFEKVTLGIKGIDVTTFESSTGTDLAADEGVYIVEVVSDTPAQKSGIQAGDVIVKVGNDETPTMTDLNKVLYKYKSGQSTKVTVNRSGKEVTVDIKF